MGVDLVKAQIRTAQGDPVFPETDLRIPRGHSIECRIYAEDPELGGVPSTGPLGQVSWPEGPGRRFDYGFDPGDEITPFYDSMIAKVIVWDETRMQAIQKIQKVLSESVVFGVKTNIPLLKKIMDHPEFVQGTMTTRFMDTHFANPIIVPPLSPEMLELVKQVAMKTAVNSGEQTPFQGFWRVI